MTDLASLTVERERIKAKLNRMKDMVDAFQEGDDLDELKLRRPDLVSAYKEFDKIQAQIEPLCTSRELTKQTASEWLNFEKLYYSLLSKIAKFLDKPILSVVEGIQNQQISELSVKLPDLNLPTFSGSYSGWTSFHDTFQTLIHVRTDLNNCQKFHYLKSCLKGDAFNTVEALSISTTNYQSAWDLLEKRYNNPRLIIQEHVNAILSINKISKISSTCLRQLINEVKTNIEALKVLKQPTDKWDALAVPIITEKLDYGTNREWQSKLTTEIPKLTSLIEFLEQRSLTLESLESLNKSNSVKASTSFKPYNSTRDIKPFRDNKGFSMTHIQINNKQHVCYYCKSSSHTIYKCPEFANLSQGSKMEKIDSMNLCKICLRSNHSTSDCRSNIKCKYCQQNHNSLLHQQNTVVNSDTQKTLGNVATYSVNEQNCENVSPGEVLLSTALIYIKDNKDHFCECRALLDVGSQSNLISESLVKRLNLNVTDNNILIQGINQKTITATQVTKVTIRSRVSTFSANISCLVLPQITGTIPTCSLRDSNIHIPNNLPLADPTFNKAGPIDLLVGAGLFWQLLGSGRIAGSLGQPQFVETSLGWVVGGEISRETKTSVCNLTIKQYNQLDNQLQKFWEIEEYSNKTNRSQEEILSEKHFVETYKRDSHGRFMVKLPFVSQKPEFGNSKERAIKRLHSLESKFKKQPALKLEYSKFINEYLQLGHMELIPNDYFTNNSSSCYIAHHEVFKQSTGKIRVVFDASAKTSNGKSLNDLLLTGPTIQQDLCSILIRFRTFQVAFSGDVIKMYRQIKVDPEHTNYQKIVWRENPEDPILTYRLLTVTYGFTCAPFLAVRSLQQAAIDEKENFPTASDVILRDFYMDDLLTGTSSVQDAIKLKEEITYILRKGGFEMSKWVSNSPEVSVSNSNEEQTLVLSNDQHAKALGVVWDYKNDFLTYQVKLNFKNNQTTKRSILSIIAQLWDPLGLASPIVIRAKLILQKMWTLKLSWDENVPEELQNSWSQFIADLENLNNIKIDRKILSNYPVSKIEIHGYCDSSQAAYGAAIFIRSVDSHNKYSINLLCSKSRVAPLKTLSIPRLELCGALLLVRLMNKILPNLNLEVDQRYFWTDSSIVLSWIAAPSNTWDTFVANRVSEVQSLSNFNEWRHISTNFNPADIISRGSSADQLKSNKLWWHGPIWLELPESQWPKSAFEYNLKNIPENRKATDKILLTQVRDELLTKFSKFVKLQRVVAFILRFLTNCRKVANRKTAKRNEQQGTDTLTASDINEPPLTGPLTTSELGYSQIRIIKLIQQNVFQSELKALKKGEYVQKPSGLYFLNPILDKDGVIRVGGRIKNSPINYDTKYPIILPAKHHVTKMLIIQEHERQLHAGAQATLAALRQKFWIISGRNVIRHILHRCIKCFRSHPKSLNQTMGNLPKQRLEPVRPFIKSGLDYIGPILIKEGSGRGKSRKVKAYIALFICLVTKAIHLELVGNLSTESFLAALRRFISRRGHVTDLFSDNATNFKGADNELRSLFKATEFQTVIDSLTPGNISWHFIPPRSPTFGGLWEANVKSVKRHLKTVIGDASLNFEEINTLLTRIEACLNSRPLCPISNDPNDLLVLTPGHFLIGEPLIASVEPDCTMLPKNRLSRWQYIEQMRQHFWSRWRKEYLSSLQRRSKWNRPSTEVKVGSMVLVNEDNIPPQQWVLGRISQLHPGTDGTTRVVSIRTSSGILKRAVNRISILPIESYHDNTI